MRHLYGQVHIPQAVYEETVLVDPDRPGAREIAAAEWIQVRTLQNDALVSRLMNRIQRGESEAIALAIEMSSMLVVDDLEARKLARELAVEITGVSGVLLAAKSEGIIDSVREALDKLVHAADYYVDERLYASVLELASES